MNGELGEHSSRRLRPHPWYLGLVAVSTFGIASLIYATFDIGSSGVALAAAVGGPIGVALSLTLHLTPTGVRIQHAEATWDQLERSRGPFGDRLRVPKTIEPRRRHRIKLFLPMWEPNWRSGTIGTHLRRHAPHLLADS